MLIDHACFAFFSESAAAHMIRLTIGRIAFPLFAFMIVRGFIYTRSRIRYAVSMLVTALASEIIYDSLFYKTMFYWENQNVIFLLLLAMLMLCAVEKFPNTALQILVIAVCCAAAYFLKLDYSFWGILVMVIFYYLRNSPFYVSGLTACLPLVLGYGTIGAFLSVIPLAFYKEAHGRFSAAGKYAFYLFYPVHLAVLLLLKTYL